MWEANKGEPWKVTKEKLTVLGSQGSRNRMVLECPMTALTQGKMIQGPSLPGPWMTKRRQPIKACFFPRSNGNLSDNIRWGSWHQQEEIIGSPANYRWPREELSFPAGPGLSFLIKKYSVAQPQQAHLVQKGPLSMQTCQSLPLWETSGYQAIPFRGILPQHVSCTINTF